MSNIQIWLGHSNIQTTMIYTHMDESDKEISAQVLITKFKNILDTHSENEIYEMEDEELNNIYEELEDSKQIQAIEKAIVSA